MLTGLKNLGHLASQPLQDAANIVNSLTKNLFSGAGQVAGDLMAGELGGALRHAGDAVTKGLGETVGRSTALLLGDSLGSLLGSTVEKGLNIVAGTALDVTGRAVDAIIAPLKAALGTSLLDFEHWAAAARDSETAAAQWGVALKASGGIAGWTGEQLKAMQEQMSGGLFGKGAIRDAQTELLRLDQVRGTVFQHTLETGKNLATAFYGGDLQSAIHALGYAIQAPEMGLQRLQRSTHLFNESQIESIKNVAKSSGTLEAQRQILDLLDQKLGAVGETMSQTLTAKLGALSRAWGAIGKEEGQIFLPLQHLGTDIMQGVVETFGGGLGPIFADLTAITKSWADGARGWIEDNVSTFRGWGADVKEIFLNVYNIGKGAFKDLFSGLDLGSFWDSFSGGVTNALRVLKDFTASWDVFKIEMKLVWEVAKDYVADFITSAKSNWRSWLDDMLKNLWDWVGRVGEVIAGGLSNALGIAVDEAFARVRDQIKARLSLNVDSPWGPTEKQYLEEARKQREAERGAFTLPPLSEASPDNRALQSMLDDTKRSTERKNTIKDLTEQLEIARNIAAFDRAWTTPEVKKKLQIGDPADTGPLDGKSQKIEFVGFADMWKKLASELGGDSGTDAIAKNTEKNTEAVAGHTKRSADALEKIAGGGRGWEQQVVAMFGSGVGPAS